MRPVSCINRNRQLGGVRAVLPASFEVYENARLVVIDREAVERLSRDYQAVGKRWWAMAPQAIPDEYEKALALLFAFNSTSFCYWSPRKWRRRFGSRWHDGSWAMFLALRRALNMYRTDDLPGEFADLTLDQYRSWIGGEGDLRSIRARWQILRKLGEKVRTVEGGFHGLIESTQWNAVVLADLLWKKYGFEDSVEYRGQKVWFLKRAQLLAADINGLTQMKLGRPLSGVDDLTGSADYKIPQYLRHRGVLRYQESLAKIVDAKKRVVRGSSEEVEIRAATIVANELLREAVMKRGEQVVASDTSDWLWLEAQKCNGMKPYHRTATTMY